MFRHLFPSLATVIVIALAAGPALSQEQGSSSEMEGAPHWVEHHEVLLNAKLGGLKAGLSLTPDQEKLWGPFETAVREAAKLHLQHMMARRERMHAMMEGMRGGEGAHMPSPVDRLDAWAMGLAEDAAAIKNIADAARPLYASLNDSQKQIFGWLGRELLMMGHRHHGMGMMMMRHHRHMMGMGGMGMMRGGHDQMGMGESDGGDHMEMANPGPGGQMYDGAGDDSDSNDE